MQDTTDRGKCDIGLKGLTDLPYAISYRIRAAGRGRVCRSASAGIGAALEHRCVVNAMDTRTTEFFTVSLSPVISAIKRTITGR